MPQTYQVDLLKFIMQNERRENECIKLLNYVKFFEKILLMFFNFYFIMIRLLFSVLCFQLTSAQQTLSSTLPKTVIFRD